jgi:rRNA processing protein Krr1/Pno1
MELLTDNDRVELKNYTLEQLYEYVKAAQDEVEKISIRMIGLNGQELYDACESLTGYNIWIHEYNKEIEFRVSINTPPLNPEPSPLNLE